MSGWGATDSDESKPKWLTADQKEDVIANASDDVDWQSTGFDVSDGGDIIVNVHYNEEVTVAGGSPLMVVTNSQAGGGSAANFTLTMDGSLPFTGDKLTFSKTIAGGGSTLSADDVLSIGNRIFLLLNFPAIILIYQ